jgi:WD40 repeat protein
MATDPTQRKLAAEYKHDVPLLSCAFDPSGRFLFAGGRDCGVLLVELSSGKTSTLAGHEGWVGLVARAGSGLVLTADQTGHVIAWDCAGKVPEQRWAAESHPVAVQGLSVSADGKLFATGDRNGTVRVWQASDGKRLHELPGIDHSVTAVAWHPDGKRLFTADRQPKKPRVKRWDVATGKEQLSIDVAELSGYRRVEDIEWGGIRGLAASPDGKQIVACGRSGYDGPMCAMVFDTATGMLVRKQASALKGFYYSVTFHPQGFYVAAGGDIGKGEFRAWDPLKDAALADGATPGPCTSLDIHPDGKRLAVTQTVGKGSYPTAGALVVYDWTA